MDEISGLCVKTGIERGWSIYTKQAEAMGMIGGREDRCLLWTRMKPDIYNSGWKDGSKLRIRLAGWEVS